MHQPPDTRHSSNSQRQFDVASIPHVDIAIVGGGPAGLSVAHSLLEARNPTNPRFHKLQSVHLFQSGSSLAFSPTGGVRDDGLTMLCSHTPRHREMVTWSEHIRARFAEAERFEFRENTPVERVTYVREPGTYLLHCPDNQKVHTDKLVLAMGHSLKEIPAHLSEHIIQGSVGLLKKMVAHEQSSPAAGRTLIKDFKPCDGTIRIGLAGVGATMLEVLKILETDIIHDSPVQLVVYDPRIQSYEDCSDVLSSLVANVCSRNRRQGLNARPNEQVLGASKEAVERIERLSHSGHLCIVPGRLNWEDARIIEGVVAADTSLGERFHLSCIIDCSPFAEGIGRQHYNVIKGLASGPLTFTAEPNHSWSATVARSFINDVALVGAAFTPKTEWHWGTWAAQSEQAVRNFFPNS